jgi:hypothetical protein
MQSASFTPKFLLIYIIFLCECDRPAAWHAFADQEAVPTVPGTSLSSNIQLPNLEFATACDVSAISFQKLSMVSKQFDVIDLSSWLIHTLSADMFQRHQRNVLSALRYVVGICYS